MWSAIGLPVAISIGAENFRKFLAGARAMDEHFRDAPLAENMPVIMGLLGVWYRNVLDLRTHAVLAYDQRLARFAAHLQQLDMESNGKRVTRASKLVEQPHRADRLGRARHQRPARLLPAAPPGHGDRARGFSRSPPSRTKSSAIITPSSSPTASRRARRSPSARRKSEVRAELEKSGMSGAALEKLVLHKVFPGNRPSNTLLYRKLDPETLGKLIALYEHKVFVQGAVWDINSFDQWGVELGKALATRLLPVVEGAPADALDSSTKGLVEKLRALKSTK